MKVSSIWALIALSSLFAAATVPAQQTVSTNASSTVGSPTTVLSTNVQLSGLKTSSIRYILKRQTPQGELTWEENLAPGQYWVGDDQYYTQQQITWPVPIQAGDTIETIVSTWSGWDQSGGTPPGTGEPTGTHNSAAASSTTAL